MTGHADRDEPPEAGQPDSAEQTSSSRRPTGLMILLPVLVLAGISAALVYIFISGGSHAAGSRASSAAGAAAAAAEATSSAGPSPAVTHSPSPAVTHSLSRASATEPKNAAALAASGGAMTVQPAHSAQAAKWAAGTGGTGLTAVSTQLGAVTQAAGMRQYANMKAACAKLAAGVKAAQAGPSIPQASMQARYATGLTDLAKGAADCQAAISEQTDGDEYVITHENSTLLSQSKSAFVAGAKALFEGTSEIQILGRPK